MSSDESEYQPFVFAAAGTAGTASPARQNTLSPPPSTTVSVRAEFAQPAAKTGNAIEIAASLNLAPKLPAKPLDLAPSLVLVHPLHPPAADDRQDDEDGQHERKAAHARPGHLIRPP